MTANAIKGGVGEKHNTEIIEGKMIVKYRIRTVRFEGEIEVEGNQFICRASENCKWMEYKSFWYIKQEIQDRGGNIEEIK